MTRYDRPTLQRLSFRRQFILGSHFVGEDASWQRIAIDATLRLTAHPDLEVCNIAKLGKSISLLGYILDPAHPAASNADIVAELLDRLHTCEDFFEHTARFGGRWVLVVNDGVRTVVFGDAAGLRQVVYTAESAPGQIWCASQPGLVAEIVGLPIDGEAMAVLQTDAHRSDYWPPGDTTPYAGIKRLLPNHYLDLGTGRPRRFWPDSDLPAMPLRAAVTKSLEILCGLMESAQRRFALMLPMTAGWDSRLMLAATRSMAQEIFFFTAVFPNRSESSEDVATPSRLLPKLGLKHRILDCRTGVDDEFAKIYRRNVIMAHEQYCPFAQALLDQTPSKGVCIKGDVGEIARCNFRLGRSSDGDVTAHELAMLGGRPTHPFVINAFEGWLSGARGHSYNVPLLDLFCWEQDAGRLHEMIEAECDIARDSFAPLNCRSLLTTMLSVPERYRQRPTFDLFRMLIERLWPDTLAEPINGVLEAGTEAAIRRTLANLGLLQLVPGPVKRTAKKLIRLIS